MVDVEVVLGSVVDIDISSWEMSSSVFAMARRLSVGRISSSERSSSSGSCTVLDASKRETRQPYVFECDIWIVLVISIKCKSSNIAE